MKKINVSDGVCNDIRGSSENRSGAYRSWKAMRQRCNQKPGQRHHQYYGAKGVGVCSEWDDFAVFYRDMGDRPEGYTLDRRDGTKDYCKENCRWATWSEQNKNKKFTELTLNGESLTIPDWSDRLGISVCAIWGRLEKGWPVEKVLQTHNEGHRLVTYNGETKPIAVWERQFGFRPSTLQARLNRGWSVEKAITTPVRGIRKRV